MTLKWQQHVTTAKEISDILTENKDSTYDSNTVTKLLMVAETGHGPIANNVRNAITNIAKKIQKETSTYTPGEIAYFTKLSASDLGLELGDSSKACNFLVNTMKKLEPHLNKTDFSTELESTINPPQANLKM